MDGRAGRLTLGLGERQWDVEGRTAEQALQGVAGQATTPTIIPAKGDAVLRVLMISYEFPPFGGGTGVACEALLRALAADGKVAVDLVTSGPPGCAGRVRLSPTIEIHRLAISKRDPHFWRAAELALWTVKAIPYARRLARETAYHLCHCWAAWPSGLAGYALRGRLPYIVGLRGSDVPGYSARLRTIDALVMRHVVRRVWTSAARVTVLSDHLRALAHRTSPGQAMEIVPNDVDVERFFPAGERSRTLLFVGRLIERKAVHLLIDALARLVPKHPDFELEIAGDGPERAALKGRVRAQGLSHRVRFLGHVERDRIADVYRRCGILVVPSLQEALGNVVLEGMASGLAIITTRTGSSELISGNGIVVEEASPGAIAAAIRRYADEPGLLARHQQRSRQLALAMSWPASAEWHLRIYNELARQHAAGEIRSGAGRDRARPQGSGL